MLLESFNFGANTFADLDTADYAAHWSQTPPPEPPATTTTTQPPPPPPTSPPPVIPPEDLSPGDEDPGGTVTAKGGDTPLPGQLVTISLSGCAPNEFVYLRMFPGPLNLGWHQADASGQVVVHARIPASYESVNTMWSGSANRAPSPGRPSKSWARALSMFPRIARLRWPSPGWRGSGSPRAATRRPTPMYCPTADTTRGQMAAFFVRGLALPPGGDQGFIDIANSVFVNAINSIAVEGITLGCNPPANDRYCPDDITSRGQMAGFFTRAAQPSPRWRPGVHRHSRFGVRQRHQLDCRSRGSPVAATRPLTPITALEDPILRQQMASFFLRAYIAGHLDSLGPL